MPEGPAWRWYPVNMGNTSLNQWSLYGALSKTESPHGPVTKEWNTSGPACYHSQRPPWETCPYHFQNSVLCISRSPGSKSTMFLPEHTANVLLRLSYDSTLGFLYKISRQKKMCHHSGSDHQQNVSLAPRWHSRTSPGTPLPVLIVNRQGYLPWPENSEQSLRLINEHTSESSHRVNT